MSATRRVRARVRVARPTILLQAHRHVCATRHAVCTSPCECRFCRTPESLSLSWSTAHFEVFLSSIFALIAGSDPTASASFWVVCACDNVKIYITHHCERTLRCSAAQTFPKQSDSLQTHSFTINNVSRINDRLGSHVLRAERASKSQSQNVSCNLGVCLRIDLTDKTVHFC